MPGGGRQQRAELQELLPGTGRRSAHGEETTGGQGAIFSSIPGVSPKKTESKEHEETQPGTKDSGAHGQHCGAGTEPSRAQQSPAMGSGNAEKGLCQLCF